MNRILLLILLMFVVTYIPRMLPVVFLHKVKPPAFLKRFFEFVPYAILSSLVFPAVFLCTGSTDSAIAGVIVSVAMSYFKLNPLFVVTGSVLTVVIFQSVFP